MNKKRTARIVNLKRLWYTILGTTISIALTFGTSAIVDYYKKKADKHEIVLMVLNDISNTIIQVQQIDSAAALSFEAELRVLEKPQTFEQEYIGLYMLAGAQTAMPPRTVENIFSYSIETVNTIGNILFTEKVSEFYQIRQEFFFNLNENLKNIFDSENSILTSPDNIANHNLSPVLAMCNVFLIRADKILEHCKDMMDVNEKDLKTFELERQKHVIVLTPEEGKENINKLNERNDRFKTALEKGRIKS